MKGSVHAVSSMCTFHFKNANDVIENGAHLAKVISISGDQHHSLVESTSMANLTVKFHLDEAGNVQVKVEAGGVPISSYNNGGYYFILFHLTVTILGFEYIFGLE